MKISETSEKYHVTSDTLRYYERIGLIGRSVGAALAVVLNSPATPTGATAKAPAPTTEIHFCIVRPPAAGSRIRAPSPPDAPPEARSDSSMNDVQGASRFNATR